MSTYRIYVTREIPAEGLSILKSFTSNITIHESPFGPSIRELKRQIRNCDGVLCLLTDKIDFMVIKAAPRLKAISLMAAGCDNVDLEAVRRRNIVVTNTPNVLTETTADLTWTLVLSCARWIVKADKFVRRGAFKGWTPNLLLGHDVYGKTLGIVGAGQIGQAVARRAVGFNMRILYTSRSRKSTFEKETGAQFCTLGTLLRQADFVSLHCPKTSETHHLIGAQALTQMKPTAFLINTARGSVVDERALTQALEQQRIAGAGLDVYEFEPRVSKKLLRLPNVVLLPHIGSATYNTRRQMAILAAQNLVAVLQGKNPLHRVV